MSGVVPGGAGTDGGIFPMSVPFALAVLFGGSGKSGYRVVEISQPQFDLVEFGWSVADRSAQDGGAVPWPGYLGARWKGALGRPGWAGG